MKAQIVKTIYVEAAHRVNSTYKKDDYTGNSYRIDLFAEGEIDPEIGWVIDYADMKHFFEPVRKQLDHACLNDIPSLENDASPKAIELWIKEQLRPWPKWFSDVRVSIPQPKGFSTTYLPADAVLGLPERLAFSFSAAQSLPQLPEGHPCRALHGHTYQVELAPENAPRMKETAASIYAHLNDTYLNRVTGLEQATAERIAAWIWHFMLENSITPELVAVQETPKNRCHYRGE
jgi:6-pyruvoyltetrahydropterin/6-carboxytetrahydropterin synthase